MIDDQEASDAATQRATVEGPVAEDGDIRLSGRYVAGHDIVFAGPPPEAEPPPFLVVDRAYLEEQAQKVKRVYVARSPDWADVVHGTDPELRFIERDQTESLHAAVCDELLAPIARGTDRQLHTLFVLGAPGAGKTTLVRRVAAMLAMAGECVVADFGVKTERVGDGDVATYIRALDRLAAEGTPVLVLLDDPFFANSGWVELLQALARPQHQGISVLGASPDFLFHRFAHWLFGKQVLGRTFDVSRPSVGEREQLALLHHRDPANSLTTDEDLLVVAMEAAAGESFRDIMQRIWMTLGGGVPVDPATDVRHLPWPVVAFAVICYFHRNYVLCPEPLLHEFLSRTLDETPPSYLAQELQELVTLEGWRIFSVHISSHGRPDSRLIGATHARVAREAWRHRPLHGLDVAKGVIDASVRAPAAVPQLAEMILVHKAPQANQLAKRVAARWRIAVERGTTATTSLCALVRALKPSRAARLAFRPALRRCLNAEDQHSWLAAWQLYHLASGELHPQEREFLMKISLPWTLKVADLSAGPLESIEIAERMGGHFREIIIERLTLSLRGELGWTADARQITWLLKSLPPTDVAALLGLVHAWLEDELLADEDDDPSRAALVIRALVPVLRTGGLLDDEESARLLGVIFDWLVAAPEMDRGVLLALLDIAETSVDEHGPMGRAILTQLFEWLCARPEDNEAEWNAFFTTLGRLPELAGEIIPQAFEWLLGRAENSESAWASLFTMLGRVPEVADLAGEIIPRAFERLRDRPENNESAWNALISTLGRAPGSVELSREIVSAAFERLLGRAETNESAWASLFTMLGRVPDAAELTREIIPRAFERLRDRPENNESAWNALISTLGRAPGSVELSREIVSAAFERLLGRAENNESAWASLFTMLGRVPEVADLAGEIIPQGFERLRDRPENNESAWNALISTLGRAPGSVELSREIMSVAFERLLGRAENNESAWASLFTTLSRLPEVADLAGEIVAQGFERLLSRTENNEHAWSALFSTLGRGPEVAWLAGEIVAQGFERLRDRPENNEYAWNSLLAVLGRVPEVAGLAREIIPLAFERLLGRTENNESVWSTLFAVLGRVPEVADLTREIIPRAFVWLRDRAENNESAWNALISTLGRAPGSVEFSREIVSAGFERLRDRPETNESVWSALFGVLGRVPEVADLTREIIPRAFVWLRDRAENNESAWNGLISTLGRAPGSVEFSREIVSVAFERLLGRTENNESAWATLFGVLGRVPEVADLAGEIVSQGFERLCGRPENNDHTWTTLFLTLRRVPEVAELAAEIVPRAFEWLRERPGPNRGAWSGLLAVLSSPIHIAVEQRAEMLDALRTWFGRHLPADSYPLRGVRLIQLADGADPELASTVAAELSYLESNPESRSLPVLVQPVAYALARTGRADLDARFAAWARRVPDDHGDGAMTFPDATGSAT